MQFKCPQCKAILASDGVTEGMKVTCPECRTAFEVKQYVRKTKLRAVDDTATGEGAVADGPLPDAIHSRVASAIGIEKLQGFKLSDLFAEVFSKHSREEVEDYFTVGTAKSTPDILEVDASWPKPWLFTRMAIASLVLYFLFWIGWKLWENPNLLPGLMLIGSFAIPISALVLFIEFNVRRNVSLYMVVRLVLLGGIISLLITHVIGSLLEAGLLPNAGYAVYLGAAIAGPEEETAKLFAMIALASAAKYRYKLNGLLVGASVGMGFAAFESAGYAFNALLADGEVEDMVANINMRGLLSPFCHIVWSAIAGCALWRLIKGQDFKWRMLCDENFIRLFLVPVVLHMIWNFPLQLPFFGNQIIAGIAGWIVCLSLVQEGLHEVAAEQAEAKKALGSDAATAAEGGAQ
jgi:RsiW-degrading membrane proteinase PrsW (M82 family)